MGGEEEEGEKQFHPNSLSNPKKQWKQIGNAGIGERKAPKWLNASSSSISGSESACQQHHGGTRLDCSLSCSLLIAAP